MKLAPRTYIPKTLSFQQGWCASRQAIQVVRTWHTTVASPLPVYDEETGEVLRWETDFLMRVMYAVFNERRLQTLALHRFEMNSFRDMRRWGRMIRRARRKNARRAAR